MVDQIFDRSIDMVVATHPDADHIGGLTSVINRYQASLFLESGNESETMIYLSLEGALTKKDTVRMLARRGMSFDLGNGAILKVLFPDRDVSKLESNTASIVLMLQHGNNSFILTGDSPSSIEKYLGSIFGPALKSNVLKAGHHGSNTSTSLEFLNFVAPSYSIISAGADNRYGHPHKDVLTRLESFGSEIMETAKLGSIVFFSDGLKLKVGR